MENFANCLNAAVIRHKGDDTFYIPMLLKGYDELFLYPAFPEGEEDEHFIMFYDELEDWDAFELAEAQSIYRHDTPIMMDNYVDEGVIVW